MTKKQLQSRSILLLFLCSTLSACGFLPTTHSSNVFALVTRLNTEKVDSHQLKTVTAHCLLGETALGGGYSTSDDISTSDDTLPSLVIEGSYPDVPVSATNVTSVQPGGWSVTAFSSAGAGTLTVDAYCLAASSPKIPLQEVQEPYPASYLQAAPSTLSGPVVLCPVGTTTLTGGFQVSLASQQKAAWWNAGIVGSEPHIQKQTGMADGWSVTLGAYDALQNVNAFALCAASSRLLPAQVVTDYALPLVKTQPLSLSKTIGVTSCGNKQFSVGGGFSFNIYSQSALTSPRIITASLNGGGISNDSSVANWTTTANVSNGAELSTSVACFLIRSTSSPA
jgi:hypothetical protein